MKRENFLCLSLVFAAVLASGLSPNSLQAGLLAYEGFGYVDPIGTPITGLNGGTGWLAAYPAPNNATVVLGENLSYPGLTSAGWGLDFNGGSGTLTTGRDWASSANSPADGTYWYSFLTRQDSAGRGTLMIFKSTSSGDGQNGFGLRIDNNGGSPQFKAWSPTQTAGGNLDFAGGYGATYFVLGRVDILSGSYSTNTVWVYQDTTSIPDTEPVSGGSTVAVDWAVASGGSTLRTTLSGRAFSNNTGLNYDEIRIGQSFADVALVPEPSTAVLLLAGVALLFRRWPRR